MGQSYRVGDEPVPGYRLIKQLGTGGFGDVWRSTSPGQIDCALKIINLSLKQGLKELKALRLVKEIRHTHLVPLQGYWIKNAQGEVFNDTEITAQLLLSPGQQRQAPRGTLMINELEASRASELIIAMGLGEMSLHQRLLQCQKQGLPGIPSEELFKYLEDAADAIDYLNIHQEQSDEAQHRVAVQHCDIKPHNIMIVSGRASVCDFGLARALGDIRMTSIGVTPAYGAPELIEEKPPTQTTDQYSLAVSYVELRTGALPFENVSYVSVVNAHLKGTLDLSRLSPAERKIILKATSRDPAARYATTTEMVGRLKRAVLGSHPTPPEEESGGHIPPPSRRPVKDPVTGVDVDVEQSPTGSTTETPSNRNDSTIPNPQERPIPLPSPPRRRWARVLVASVGVLLLAGVGAHLNDPTLIGRAGAVVASWIPRPGGTGDPPPKKPEDEPPVIILPIDVTIELVTTRINRAQELLSTKPHESLRQCDEALEKLDNADRFAEWDDLREQVLLLMARANSRLDPPQWDEVAQKLTALDALQRQADEEPDRRALRLTLAVMEAADSSSKTSILESLELLRPHREAMQQLSQVENFWQPNQAEVTRAEGAVGDLVQDARDAMRKESDLVKRLKLCQALRAWLPEDYGLLLDNVRIFVVERKFDQAAGELGAARIAVPTDLRPQADGLTLVTNILQQLDASPPTGPDDSPEGCKRRYELLQHLRPSVLLVYGEELVGFAEANPKFHEVALADWNKALPLLETDSRDGLLERYAERLGELKKKFAKLLGDRGQYLGDELIAALEVPGKPDFDALLEKCRRAEAAKKQEHLAHIVSAECLVELAGSAGTVTDTTWRQATSLVQKSLPKIDAGYRRYGLYVKGLVKSHDPEATTAPAQHTEDADWPSDLMMQACEGVNLPRELNPHRRQRTATILVQGAHRLRLRDDATFSELVSQPFGDHAHLGLGWLKQAWELVRAANAVPFDLDEIKPGDLNVLKQLDPAAPDDLVLLAWHASEEGRLPKALAANAIDLQKAPFTRHDVPLLHVFAQAQKTETPEGRWAAISAYAELHRLATVQPKWWDSDAPPVDLYETIIAPALAAADEIGPPAQLNDAQRKQIAALYGAKGKLLQKFDFEDGKFDDQSLEVIGAFKLAIDFDERAEFFVGRGVAALDRSRKGEELAANEREAVDSAILADAKKAIELDPKFAKGHTLLGNALVRNSRTKDNPAERAKQLADAIEACSAGVTACEQQVKLAPGVDEHVQELAYALISRSTAEVEVVSYRAGELNRDQMAATLQLAADDARRSLELESGYQDYAWHSLGNALEDLAWLAKKDPERNYMAAIKAFDDGITAYPLNASLDMARGRCRFKAVAYGNMDWNLLSEGVNDLEAALGKDPGLSEAHYWTGRICYLQGNRAMAEARRESPPTSRLMQTAREKYAAAEIRYSKRLEVRKKDDAAMFGKAQVLAALANYDQADKTYLEAVQLSKEAGSNNWVGYLSDWAATLNLQDPKVKNRISPFDQYIAPLQQERSPAAKLVVGTLWEAKKDWGQAEIAYDQALGQIPLPGSLGDERQLYVRLHVRRSFAIWQLLKQTSNVSEVRKKATKAIADANQAALMYGPDANDAEDVKAGKERDQGLSYFQAAEILQLWGDKEEAGQKIPQYDRALVEYQKAVAKLKPDKSLPASWIVRHNLVDCSWRRDPKLYEDKSKYDKAIKLLTEAKSCAEGDTNRARIDRLKVDLEKARTNFLK